MANYVQLTTASDYISTDISTEADSAGWSLKFRLNENSVTSDSYHRVAGATIGSSNRRILIPTNGDVWFGTDGTAVQKWIGAGWALGDDVEFVYDGAGSVTLYLNGVSKGAKALAGNLQLDVWGVNYGTYSAIALDYITFECQTYPENSRNYQPSATYDRTDPTLYDIGPNRNHGTLVNATLPDAFVQYNAIEPTDFARKCRAQVTHVTGSELTGFVALLELPTEFSSVSLNSGQDVVVCASDDGLTRYPLEVVTPETSPGNGEVYVWMPTADYLDELWMLYGQAGFTQPGANELYGADSMDENTSTATDYVNARAASAAGTFFTLDAPQDTAGGGVTYAISLDAGSYNYAGDTIDLLASRFIGLGAGGYSYSDNDVDLIANRSMLLIAGSYALTGQDASLAASRVMQLDSGSYFYAGYNVDLIYTPIGGSTYTISLDAGIYSAAGVDVDLIANRIITLDDESYIYTEYDVNISVSRTLTLNSGDYAYSGEYLTLLVNRFIALDDAIYAYAGEPAVLTYSGEVIALISGYSVNYKQDGIAARFANDYISARFN